jgi:hypothetical protein
MWNKTVAEYKVSTACKNVNYVRIFTPALTERECRGWRGCVTLDE